MIRFATVTSLATIAGLLLFSTGPSNAGGVRDHRSNSNAHTYGCYGGRCSPTTNSQGGVAVTSGGKVVPTTVAPAGGSFGGTVHDHRGK